MRMRFARSCWTVEPRLTIVAIGARKPASATLAASSVPTEMLPSMAIMPPTPSTASVVAWVISCGSALSTIVGRWKSFHAEITRAWMPVTVANRSLSVSGDGLSLTACAASRRERS